MSSGAWTSLSAFLGRDRIIAPPGFNRWRIPSVSIAIHLCIGSVYAWSIFNPALARELGVVANAASDWSVSDVVWVFSVAIVFVGLTAALAGRWLEKVGPRAVGVTSAALWGSGFIVSAVGIYYHQLWVLYLGYGVLGGCGLGLGYVSPVATLIRWFPDRRGMATGMAIMGFGGGAIIAAPLKEYLIRFYYDAPTYLGSAADVQMTTESGRRFAEIGGQMMEVVVVSAADVAMMTMPGAEGVYVVGTGSSGAAATFLTLGIAYFLVIFFASLMYRIPADDWKPDGWEPEPETDDSASRQTAHLMITTRNVHVNQVHKTPQFWLLWIALCFNITAGIGVIGVAKTMMSDIFGSTLPHIATPAFAATYVLMISVFNMLGRFFWAYTSDYIGRKRTYYIFFALGALLYLSIPVTANLVEANPLVVWLVLFYAATMMAFTMFGGAFATIPAYLADLFGSLHIGAIHGRLLTAWSAAGVLGPFAITYLREFSARRAIGDLSQKVDPAAFQERFGAPLGSLNELVAAKTVTIAKLMEIAPPGIADPTPGIYNITMYGMAVLLVIAFFANRLVRPVAEKRHLENTHPDLSAETQRAD